MNKEWKERNFLTRHNEERYNERVIQPKRMDKYKMKYLPLGFTDCKAGALLLTRRSERRYAEQGNRKNFLY